MFILPGRSFRLGGGLALLGLVVLAMPTGCGERTTAPPPPSPVEANAVEARENALAAIDRLLEARRVDEAARVAERLAEVHPDDAAVALRLGRVRVADPRRDLLSSAAADALLRAIEGGIEDPETFALAATLLESCDRDVEAEPLWRRLADDDPGDPEPPLRLALNLESQGRRGEAVAIAETTRDRHPDHAFAAVVLGELRLASGDERGLEALAEGVRLDPGQDAWRLRQAVWLRRLGRCEEAILILAASSAETPSGLARTREIAACWRRLQRPGKEASTWTDAARRRDLSPAQAGEAWREAARSHLDAGEREAAWRCLQEAAVADPEHPMLAELERAVAGASGESPADPG
jgi:tetratricopeptide (TPR) repeat protein